MVVTAIFGAFFARGLADRFKRISATIDLWSAGDFSLYIDDATGDEIAQFTRRLDRMAEQLQSLLRRRQGMAVSEERNRLARDLHDSAKQKAFAALAQLGTATGILERKLAGAEPHLLEAENVVYEVIQELSFLIQEIYPMALQTKGLSTTLRDYTFEWENRNDIPVKLDIQDPRSLGLETGADVAADRGGRVCAGLPGDGVGCTWPPH